jgi:hypothetical protein
VCPACLIMDKSLLSNIKAVLTVNVLVSVFYIKNVFLCFICMKSIFPLYNVYSIFWYIVIILLSLYIYCNFIGFID